jgi:Protein of unknown function (DUF2752)
MWLPAFAIPARIARDDWSRHLLGRLGASILAGVGLVALPDAVPASARWTGAACLLGGLTGLPCPGCGITTSLLALARGHAHASWSANPAGLGVAALLIGQAVVASLAMRRGVPTTGSLACLSWLDRIAIGGLLAAWAARLIWTLS